MGNRLPFQILPEIFSSIDAYTKRVVHGLFDDTGKAPDRLRVIGGVTGYAPPQHHSSSQFCVEDLDMLLTGGPDGVLVLRDESHVIIDYKTAKFTGT